MVSRPGLTNRDLVEFCDRARREFYLRPAYVGRKLLQSLTDLHEFKRLLKGAWSLSRHLFKETSRPVNAEESDELEWTWGPVYVDCLASASLVLGDMARA